MRKQYATTFHWMAAWGALITFIGAGSAEARSIGIDTPQMPGGPVTCSGVACHGSADSEASVTITGPDSLSLNETASYTIEISNYPIAQVGAGLTVVAFLDQILTNSEDAILDQEEPGVLQITAPGVGLFTAGGQLTHVSRVASTGVFSYDFIVTAPAFPGDLELRGAMNAFDGSLSPFNDHWNHTSYFVAVPEPSGGILAFTAVLGLAALRRGRSC